jgi:hypothetical protein
MPPSDIATNYNVCSPIRTDVDAEMETQFSFSTINVF